MELVDVEQTIDGLKRLYRLIRHLHNVGAESLMTDDSMSGRSCIVREFLHPVSAAAKPIWHQRSTTD